MRRCWLRVIRAPRSVAPRAITPAGGVDAIECDRRPQIEPGAVIEEIGRDVLSRTALQAGRPAEHADLVVVAFALDVGAGLDEQPDRLQIAAGGGEVERRARCPESRVRRGPRPAR